MKLFKCLSALALAAIVCCLLASCSPQKSGGSKTASGGKTYTIGVSLLTEEHPFYRELKSALIEQCKARGIHPIILSCNMDLPTQTAQVENFINQGVNAIVVCPAKSAGIAGAIRKANKAGVPVFTADIAAQGGKVVSHIASDNVDGGRQAADCLAKLLKEKGNVVIVDCPDVQSVQDRTKGFREGIAKYPNMKIVDAQSAEAKRDMAVTVTENLLQKHPVLDGIFAINDSSALGALAAVEQSGRKNIAIVGFDGDPEARKKIASDSALKADVVQYPKEIGKATVNSVADYLQGKKVPSRVPVAVGIIDSKTKQSGQE